MKKPSRDPSTLPPGSPEAITARLEEMERKIERLRSMYETFFSGIERQAPHAPRRELNRLMLETQQIQIRNAALRFRFQSLSQRWTLMTTYWNRTLREIEAGTYRKDVAKVSRRLAQKGVPLSEQEAIALGIPSQRARALVARQAAAQARQAASVTAPAGPPGTPTPGPPGTPGTPGTPSKPTTAPEAQQAAAPAPVAGDSPSGGPPPPAPASIAPAKGPPPIPRAAPRPAPATPAVPPIPGMSDDELAALHRRYDEAARGTDRPAPSLAKLRQHMVRFVPAVMAQLGTQDVTFDVTIKDGRVVLRPKPRK